MRDPVTLLVAMAEKKPFLKVFLEKIPALPLDEIDRERVPGWARRAAHQIKKNMANAELEQKRRIAMEEILQSQVEAESTANIKFDVYRWKGGDTWLSRSDNDSMTYLISQDQRFMLTPDGVWLGHIFVRGLRVDLSLAEYITSATRGEYSSIR